MLIESDSIYCMVRWMSGRSQLTANESASKGLAGSNPALTEINVH